MDELDVMERLRQVLSLELDVVHGMLQALAGRAALGVRGKEEHH
jgi:hypothetical protein